MQRLVFLINWYNEFRFSLGGTVMLYNIGDILVCKNIVNTQCLEMTNPCFDVKSGERYKVTDKDDFPDDHHCHWYELTSEKDTSIVLNAWNDEDHMIIDDKFEKA